MITLTITHEDLLAGILNSPTSDPIALAAQRVGLLNPRVGLTGMSFAHGQGRAHVPFGPELKQFVSKLAYGDKYEILPVIRDKKGNITGHEPAVFQLKTTDVELEERKAA